MIAEWTWPWATLLLLGALHGVNPGMGWLFAVALGMQEGDRRAVWRALVPLAMGHAAAIAAALVVAMALGGMLPLTAVKWVVAISLVTLGIRQLVRHRHVRWGGMRVGFRDLAIWSFLMASAHGAGLMAVPFVMDGQRGPEMRLASPASESTSADANTSARHVHVAHASMAGMGSVPAGAGEQDGGAEVGALVATLAHSVGYLLVTALVAVLVYERFGLRLLRSAWVNLDALWAVALVVTGVVAVAR